MNIQSLYRFQMRSRIPIQGSVGPLVHQSVHWSVHPSVRPSVRPSVHKPFFFKTVKTLVSRVLEAVDFKATSASTSAFAKMQLFYQQLSHPLIWKRLPQQTASASASKTLRLLVSDVNLLKSFVFILKIQFLVEPLSFFRLLKMIQ